MTKNHVGAFADRDAHTGVAFLSSMINLARRWGVPGIDVRAARGDTQIGPSINGNGRTQHLHRIYLGKPWVWYFVHIPACVGPHLYRHNS